jgi:hypothetical protein
MLPVLDEAVLQRPLSDAFKLMVLKFRMRLDMMTALCMLARVL